MSISLGALSSVNSLIGKAFKQPKGDFVSGITVPNDWELLTISFCIDNVYPTNEIDTVSLSSNLPPEMWGKDQYDDILGYSPPSPSLSLDPTSLVLLLYLYIISTSLLLVNWDCLSTLNEKRPHVEEYKGERGWGIQELTCELEWLKYWFTYYW